MLRISKLGCPDPSKNGQIHQHSVTSTYCSVSTCQSFSVVTSTEQVLETSLKPLLTSKQEQLVSSCHIATWKSIPKLCLLWHQCRPPPNRSTHRNRVPNRPGLPVFEGCCDAEPLSGSFSNRAGIPVHEMTPVCLRNSLNS